MRSGGASGESGLDLFNDKVDLRTQYVLIGQKTIKSVVLDGIVDGPDLDTAGNDFDRGCEGCKGVID